MYVQVMCIAKRSIPIKSTIVDQNPYSAYMYSSMRKRNFLQKLVFQCFEFTEWIVQIVTDLHDCMSVTYFLGCTAPLLHNTQMITQLKPGATVQGGGVYIPKYFLNCKELCSKKKCLQCPRPTISSC